MRKWGTWYHGTGEVPMVHSEAYLTDEEDRKWSPKYNADGFADAWVQKRRRLGHINTDTDKQIMATFWEDLRKITRIKQGEEWYKYYDEMQYVHWWPEFKYHQLRKLCHIPGHNIVLFPPNTCNEDWMQDLIYNVPMETLKTGVDVLTAMAFLKDLFDADPPTRDTSTGQVYLAMLEVGRRYKVLMDRMKATETTLEDELKNMDQPIGRMIFPVLMYSTFSSYSDRKSFQRYLLHICDVNTNYFARKIGPNRFSESALKWRINLANMALILATGLQSPSQRCAAWRMPNPDHSNRIGKCTPSRRSCTPTSACRYRNRHWSTNPSDTNKPTHATMWITPHSRIELFFFMTT